MRARRRIFTGYPVGPNGTGTGNFFVESVFYEREYKAHEYEFNCDGQAGDVGGPAATRELPADPFRRFHDVVDSGISFLLFVHAVCGCIRGDDAGSAFATGTRSAPA